MYLCLDCLTVFEEPRHYIERHGLHSPPYEEWDGCPKCSGAYVETYECNCCGKYITTEDYIKTMDGDRFCEDCIKYMKLGDE